MKGWFYLGAAGLIGALAGWAVCEPAFIDGEGHRWGNIWLMPLVLTLLCVGLGVAESVVERSTQKALIRGGLCLPLGVILGFVFSFIANLIFTIGMGIVMQLGVMSVSNPGLWIVRAVAWMVFGAAGGIVYGIVGKSSKKAVYGVLGGIIGAGLGGLLFDPISLLTAGGGLSRAVGFSSLGLATGMGVGIVESALKDRWLYVCAGPLGGKQFILYKPLTTLGSEQSCDIYLFKDPSIHAQHAVLESRGPRVQVHALATVHVNGQPVQARVLQSGDLIQIGRYAFRYQEKQRPR
jgi:hypothetical protein